MCAMDWRLELAEEEEPCAVPRHRTSCILSTALTQPQKKTQLNLSGPDSLQESS